MIERLRRLASEPLTLQIQHRSYLGPRVLTRIIVLFVILGSVGLAGGQSHAHVHWLLVAGYAATSLMVAAEGKSEAPGRLWLSTLVDAVLAGYILSEHLIALDEAERVALDAIGQLTALLLLLASGFSLRLRHTAVFVAVVAAIWTAAIAIAHGGGISSLAVKQQLFGLAGFVAAGGLVLYAMAGLREAVSQTLDAERERTFLARFVPPGTNLGRFDGAGSSQVEPRHACLLSVDIRGFSQMSRDFPRQDVMRWLLQIRALANAGITAEGGIVDKYVGDGILAQFLEGDPREQATAALRAVTSINERLAEMNAIRVKNRMSPIRLVTSLHAGIVLAGVFDDGWRAELTVLGTPMNELSRIERRAKDRDIDTIASIAFIRLLDDQHTVASTARPLDRSVDDDAPELASLDLAMRV